MKVNPWLRLLLTIGLVWLATELGWADDCSSPEDAMDTLWLGPPLKGIISVIIAVAVNGQTILSQVLQRPPGPGTPEGEAPPPPELRLEVNTQDRRTDLAPGAEEGLWVYASIRARNAPPALVSAAFSSISFSGDPNLSLSAVQHSGSSKAVYVRALETSGESPPASATLAVHAVLAVQPVVAPVVFSLAGGYELEIQTSSAWRG